MTLLILYLLVAILVSFLCSMLEAVILSITPSFMAIKKEQGKKYMPLLSEYKNKIDRPLAAILTLNTFAHTLGAAGVGAQAQVIWGNEYLSVVSALLTILILVFSEIIPKTIGANFWPALVPFTVYTLRFLIVVLYPFVFIRQLITRAFNIKSNKGALSRADFSVLAELAAREGLFREGESKIIKNISLFDQIKARHIMTPRTVIFAAPGNLTIKEYYASTPEMPFSRIPVYKNNIDQITGYLLKDELLTKIVEGQSHQLLNSISRDILSLYVNLPISQIYQELISSKQHIALVVDEYGGTSGIITLEDVVETILGLEIVDEMDNIEDLQKAARESWEKRSKRMGFQK